MQIIACSAPVSLLTGNFTGNSPKLRPPATSETPICTRGAEFSSKFPSNKNRELFLTSREFRGSNRDVRSAPEIAVHSAMKTIRTSVTGKAKPCCARCWPLAFPAMTLTPLPRWIATGKADIRKRSCQLYPESRHVHCSRLSAARVSEFCRRCGVVRIDKSNRCR